MEKRRSVKLAVVLMLAACSGDSSMLETNDEGGLPLGAISQTTVKGVVVSADVQRDPDDPGFFVLSLTLRNETTGPVIIEWRQTPGCKFWRRAYDVGNAEHEARWDPTRHRGEWDACTRELLRTNVPAGSTSVGPKVLLHTREVLGDSLPEGDYLLTLTVAPDGQIAELSAGTVALTRGGW